MNGVRLSFAIVFGSVAALAGLAHAQHPAFTSVGDPVLMSPSFPSAGTQMPLAPGYAPSDAAPGGFPGTPRDLAEGFVGSMNPFSEKAERILPGYWDPYGAQASYGICGYQPWRLGWQATHDWAILPFASTFNANVGEMQIVEVNNSARLSEVIAPGVLFNGTGYFNAHFWDGPGKIGLPGQVDQISTDLELGFFDRGPWTAQVAFHPQIVDGNQSRLNPYAFNFDGRVVVSYLASPEWTFVGGVAFWDRVDLLVVPQVGAVWTPVPRWEFRLLYPKARISYYLGRRGPREFWLYGAAEYTAEAWQANIGNPTIVADRIQLTDHRLLLGFRWDNGRRSAFIEGGWIFDRQAIFAGPTPDFDLSNVGTIRAGIRF